MNNTSKFATPQEEFWAGTFGVEYSRRSETKEILASNLNFFVRALDQISKIDSCLEFGANVGMNLRALRLLFPNMNISGIEINPEATKHLIEFLGEKNVFAGSIFDYQIKEQVDLTLIKGVLIHINPEMLVSVYEKLYQASRKYILVCEYYNPVPVSIPYRGHENRLFKRDFAGEMLEKYPDLELLNYGFAYKRDKFHQDDITWFLMKKRG